MSGKGAEYHDYLNKLTCLRQANSSFMETISSNSSTNKLRPMNYCTCNITLPR